MVLLDGMQLPLHGSELCGGGEEDSDSVSDPSDLSSGEDDLVGEEIHF